MISGDTARTPNEGQTAGSQSVENSGTALRMACAEARADPARAAAQRLGVAADQLTRRRRRRRRAGRTQDRLRRAAAALDLAARGDRQDGAEAAGEPQDRRQVRSRASTSRPKSPAGRHTCRTCACRHAARPRGAPAALRREARQCRTKPRRRRCRAWSRWCATAPSSASSPSARSRRSRRAKRLRKSAKWTAGPELPDPARIFEVIKALPSKDATIGVKQAHGARRARTFEATYTKPYMAHASIGPSCARRRVQGRQADGLDAFARRVSAARASSPRR